MVSGMSYLTANSEPDTHGHGGAYTRQSHQSTEFGPIGKSPNAKVAFPTFYVQIGQFDYENRNRAFAIEGVPTGLAYLSLAEFFSVSVPKMIFGISKNLLLTLHPHSAVNSGHSRVRF